MTMTWQNGRELATLAKDGKTISYSYNADGIRSEKNNNGVVTKYFYDSNNNLTSIICGDTQLVFYYDVDGQADSFIVYSGDTATRYYYVKNLQGDITKIMTADGAVVANYYYSAYGEILSITDADGAEISDMSSVAFLNPLRYRGYLYDSDTGFYYLQSRYYDPEISRFINEDTYFDTGNSVISTNMFAYCENNSISFIDPSGDTCYYFYGKDQEEAARINCKRLSKKYSVVKYKITSKSDFDRAWGKMGRVHGGRGAQKKIDVVVINLHGNPYFVQYIDHSIAKGKTIDTLFLLSCNAGHQDYKYSNPAYKLYSQNTIRQLIACDGTHYRKINLFKTKVTLQVKGNSTFKSYLRYGDRKSKGFVVYGGSKSNLCVSSIGSKFNTIDELFKKVGKW